MVSLWIGRIEPQPPPGALRLRDMVHLSMLRSRQIIGNWKFSSSYLFFI